MMWRHDFSFHNCQASEIKTKYILMLSEITDILGVLLLNTNRSDSIVYSLQNPNNIILALYFLSRFSHPLYTQDSCKKIKQTLSIRLKNKKSYLQIFILNYPILYFHNKPIIYFSWILLTRMGKQMRLDEALHKTFDKP